MGQATSPGVSHTVLKREAEADHHYMTYGYPAVQPLVYKQPFVQPLVYKQPVVTPVVYKTHPVNYAAGSFANDAVKPFDYAAKGKYVANSAGTVHIAKREADPYTVGYNTYQTGPLSFVKQPIVQQPSSFSPVTYHTYGKREAEAEAEPWTVYGGAYGYPYTTYGGYGYRTPYTYSSLNYGNRFYY